MQFVRNDQLVRRESRIGGVLLVVTFGVLAIGLYASGQLEQLARSPDTPVWVPIAGSYLVVAVGLLLLYLGNSRVKRYGPQYRQDDKLRLLLKSFDHRYVLLAFLNRRLPDYLLIGPSGVWVIVTRTQKGLIFCRADRWTRRTNPGMRIIEGMYGTGIGNPGLDVSRGIQQVSAELSKKLPSDRQPTINGAIVFTGDGVRLRIDRCSYTVVAAKELRRVLGRQKDNLPNAAITEVVAALRGAMQD